MRSRWFESVAEAQRRAERRLPRSVYGALLAGSESGLSYEDNLTAFRELGFAPRIADLPAKRDLGTTIMGQPLSMPVLISPTGVQAVHPDGEVAVARAAAARGVAMGLSSFASKPIEAVVEANAHTFFQMYWMGGRDHMLTRMLRAKDAGAAGLILTLDWCFATGRDWGSPWIPEQVDLKAMTRLAPQVMVRPRWLFSYLRTGRVPDLTTPNLAHPGVTPPTFFGAYAEWMQTPPPTWADVAWLRERWGGPFMVKGIGRVEDARWASEIGATAISVSNHGGNNLDGTAAPLRVLPAIVDAVGSEVEVLLDGGVRRGSDVVKAVALGARAVMIGRAYLWGLAADGQAGVENVLDILRSGIDSTLLALGKSSLRELEADDILIPAGFTRSPGSPARAPETGRPLERSSGSGASRA